jgi:26S proteasome regulatory subunit (ATPase 3-interacting protein)
MSTEQLCLALIKEGNKPYNVQGVSDMLASKGVKKAAVEKTLVSLAEADKINVKLFGKTKLYIPKQDGLSTLSPEEKAKKMQDIAALQVQVKQQEEKVAELRKQFARSQSQLTVEELQTKLDELSKRSTELESKLDSLRNGVQLVSADEVKKVEAALKTRVDGWAKFRRVFRALFDQITENIDQNQKDLMEEMGVDSDQAVGENLDDYQRLVSGKKARR